MNVRDSLPAARFLVLALLALLFCTAGAQAAWVSLGGNEGERVGVTVVSSAPGRIVIEYIVPGFEADPVAIDGRTFYRITIPGESNLLEEGFPELPHVCRSVIIPDREAMQARVVDAETVELAGYPVVPSKGNLLRTVDPASVPWSFGAAYGGNDLFPAQALKTGEPYILRDYRGLVIEVAPLQARPAGGTLLAMRRIVVELTSAGPDLRNIIERSAPPSTVPEAFDDLYRQHFLNYAMDRYTPVPERGKMLVISYDAFASAMTPLIDWKNQSGMPTRIVNVSTIGTTAAAIKSYILTAYQQEQIAFVLLVGDGAQIPTFSAAGGSSDPTYSLLAGSDNYPEILVGRFSAETIAHVQTQVARSVGYEKTPMDGAAWYHLGTGIGSDQGPGDDGEYDYQHIENIRTDLMRFTYTAVDQIYDPGASAAMVTAALNAGRSIVNYCGHGSQTSWGTTGFSNTNVNALQNDWMLPFIFSVACVNGQFDGSTCFAEAWMRATHNGNPTGAIGTYMSSINQSWNPPMVAEDECDDLLVGNQKRTFGGLCYNGSCRMLDESGADGANMFLTWHVFGDPSLVVRTATPSALTVQHAGAMFPGQADYTVAVPGTAGALCAIFGNGILYGSVLTDPAGNATIHMTAPPQEPTTLTLTITAFNRMPFIAPIEVLPPTGPYVVYDGTTVQDPAPGDADGAGDAGEQVGADVRLKNIGVETATAVHAVLSSADANVEVAAPEAEYGDIASGGIASPAVPFGLRISPNAPDQHVIPFEVAVQGTEGSWSCAFNLTVSAPVLASGNALIDDSSPGGNSDGGIDPGEEFALQLMLVNTGHAPADSLTGTLSSTSIHVTFVDDSGECLLVPIGGQEPMTGFRLQVSGDCPDPASLPFHLTLTDAAGFSAGVDFELPVGAWFDDAEIDRGWSLGAEGDNAASGLWVRADPVGTTYNGQQCQPEDDHTADPGTICFVTGNGSPGGTAGEQDVDGGKTTLLSPEFALDGAVSATLTYWRWYTNNLGNSPNQDYWDVDVTADGANWVHLEHTTNSANSWTEQTFNLQDFVTLTNHVQVRFVANDVSPNSLLEAAVDDVTLSVIKPPSSTGVDPVEVRSGNGFVLLGPNPVRTKGTVVFRVSETTPASIKLYDVGGRAVRTLLNGRVGPGEHSVPLDRGNLASGIYFLRLETDRVVEVKQIAIVR